MVVVAAHVYAKTMFEVELDVLLDRDPAKTVVATFGAAAERGGASCCAIDAATNLRSLCPRIHREVLDAADNPMHPLTAIFAKGHLEEKLALCEAWTNAALQTNADMVKARLAVQSLPRVTTAIGPVLDHTARGGKLSRYAWDEAEDAVGALYRYSTPAERLVLELNPAWRDVFGGKRKLSYATMEEMHEHLGAKAQEILREPLDGIAEQAWPTTEQMGLWLVSVTISAYFAFATRLYYETRFR